MPRSTALLLALLVIISQFLDFASTYHGVTSGAAQEANPLMIWAMQHRGWAGFIAVKLVATALMLWLTWRRFGAAVAFCGIYLAIAGWNMYVGSKGL